MQFSYVKWREFNRLMNVVKYKVSINGHFEENWSKKSYVVKFRSKFDGSEVGTPL